MIDRGGAVRGNGILAYDERENDRHHEGERIAGRDAEHQRAMKAREPARRQGRRRCHHRHGRRREITNQGSAPAARQAPSAELRWSRPAASTP